MKRRSLAILAAAAIAALGFVGTNSAAFAVTTTVNGVVGHSQRVVLGGGTNPQPFLVATCTSASPNVVACGTLTGVHPVDKVRVWCLAPTAVGGVAVTVDYVPNAPNAAIAPTVLTVNCTAGGVPTLRTPNSRTSSPVTQATSVTGCTTNVMGTSCTMAGHTIARVCEVQAAMLNTLPVLVTAQVTVAGPPAINGKTVNVYFICD